MNKRFQFGFSLAEILIALGIISIVATMGFSISKKGLERAYNQYFHTGYTGIQAALADAHFSGASNKDNYIRDLFRGKIDNGVIIAPNNIKFKIDEGSNSYKIVMTVPGANGSKTIDLYYMPDKYNFLLVGGTYQDRIDLLPFYVDDGIKGRLIKRYDAGSGNFSNPIYTKRKFYSFKDAFCAVYPSTTVSYSGTNIIECTNTTATENGVLRVADPRKVF